MSTPTPTVVPDLSGLVPLAGLIPNPVAALIVATALRYGPQTAAYVIQLVHNENPTLDDYKKLLASFGEKSYDDYIKEDAAHG